MTKVKICLYSYLQTYISGARDFFDFIIIDCPPAIGGIYVNNALVIADYVVMPIGAEDVFALKGIRQFDQAIQVIRENITPDLRIIGTLVTMYDSRTLTSRSMYEAIIQHLGCAMVFQTLIHRNTAVNRANINHCSVIDYAKKAAGVTVGADDYRKFSGELLERLKK